MEVITDGIGFLLGSNIGVDDTDKQAAANALAEHVLLQPLLGYGFRFGYYPLTFAGMPFYRVYLMFPAEIHEYTRYEGIDEYLDAFLYSQEVVTFLDSGVFFAFIETRTSGMSQGSSLEWAGALYLFWITAHRSMGQEIDPIPLPPYHQPAFLVTYNILEEVSLEQRLWREKTVTYWQMMVSHFKKGKILAAMGHDMFSLFVLAMAFPFSESKTNVLREFWATLQHIQDPQ